MLYRVSAGFSARENNANGHHCPSICCGSSAPTEISNASIIKLVGASKIGLTRSVVLARVCLNISKAAMASSAHSGAWEGRFVC